MIKWVPVGETFNQKLNRKKFFNQEEKNRKKDQICGEFCTNVTCQYRMHCL